MNLKNYLLVLIGIAPISLLSAQVTFSERQFFPTSVNNEGIVVGHKDQNTPHQLWNPQTGKFTKIGGMSAGNGLGGVASFSDDGKFISATDLNGNVPLSTEWQKVPMTDWDMSFKGMRVMGSSLMLAVGSSADGKSGDILFSTDGHLWRISDISIQGDEDFAGLEAIGHLNFADVMVGGHEGAVYVSTTQGAGWTKVDIHPQGNTQDIDVVWAIDFIPEAESNSAIYGAVGLEFKDGEYGVWATKDSGDSFYEATGVAGVPVHIAHFADMFYLVTRNGHVQQSKDQGATWTTLFTTENNAPLHCVEFADEDNGMALSKGVIYVTSDAGKIWIKKEVAHGVTDNTDWNSVYWRDAKNAIIVGSNNAIYETTDAGNTWENKSLDGTKAADLYMICANGSRLSICGDQCSFYTKSEVSSAAAYGASRYDVANNTWTPMQCSGYISDNVTSSAYGISGDGKLMFGASKTFELHNAGSAVQSNAALWLEDGTYMNLGSKFADRNRMSRASASSFDGSVIVGCQDIWGPWYASVWRKNANGTYEQKLMLKDPDKTEADINFEDQNDMMANLLGLCNVISSDGKWIGGRGDDLCGSKCAWIWSEESGLIELEDQKYMGTVSGMRNDASLVVGWHSSGESDPWIWTKEKGMEPLNDYVEQTLGFDLGEYYLCSVFDMSPNGRYITGWCMKDGSAMGYVIDLQYNNVGIKAMEQCKAAVYPNPVSDELHIDCPFDDVKTNIRLLDIQGRTVKQMDATSVSNTMTVSDVTSGLYILDVEAEGVHKTFKVEVVH